MNLFVQIFPLNCQLLNTLTFQQKVIETKFKKHVFAQFFTIKNMHMSCSTNNLQK